MKKFLLIISVIMLCSCAKQESEVLILPKENFTKQLDGKQVDLFTLKNDNGIVTQITNFGGRVVTLWTPDKDGKMEDIVLGHETIDGYLGEGEKYFGALIGRYGNRIAKGKFTLDGKEYKLAINNDENHLHGGIKGFNDVVWDAKQFDNQTLELTYVSKDMEEGYPGELTTKVVYTLTDNNELKVEYWVTTNAPTVASLTHHSFFNLKGAGKGEVTDHILTINADKFTPTDSGLIPTGELALVDGTPMDFKTPTVIGERVNDNYDQLVYGKGYDHNWVLNANGDVNIQSAKIKEPVSGRTIEVYTNQPGMQFYGGNFLTGKDTGKYGQNYGHRSAFCLETQSFPDSPNQPNFPSTRLEPGKEYYWICIYKFGVENL